MRGRPSGLLYPPSPAGGDPAGRLYPARLGRGHPARRTGVCILPPRCTTLAWSRPVCTRVCAATFRACKGLHNQRIRGDDRGMRARPNPSGEQIVTDYLTRVAQAARLLPKGARGAFVGRTKSLVERELGPPGTRTDPEHVIEVLARLGKPEDLVMEERTRIDRGWVKNREGDAAAAALTGPRMNRPLTSRRRPNSDTQQLYGRPGQPGPDGTVTGPDGTVTGPDGTVTGPDGTVTRPDGTVTRPDGTVTGPDGTVTGPDGTVTGPDGTVTGPDGTVTG